MQSLRFFHHSLTTAALALGALVLSLAACEPEQPGADAGTGAGCAATLCPVDTYCDDISGSAQCLPLPSCKTVKCSAGYHCELNAVQCIRAPCPAQPQCVPDAAGAACGKATCAAGLECCNASCGTCVKPGMACIQIACQ
jgi:hypothetical protein